MAVLHDCAMLSLLPLLLGGGLAAPPPPALDEIVTHRVLLPQAVARGARALDGAAALDEGGAVSNNVSLRSLKLCMIHVIT
jgi:hypothetical protein